MVWSHGACHSEVLAVLYKGKIRKYVKWSTCMNSAQCTVHAICIWPFPLQIEICYIHIKSACKQSFLFLLYILSGLMYDIRILVGQNLMA